MSHIMSAKKLATGLSARTARAERALRKAGVGADKLRSVRALDQASASEAQLANGHTALISYETLVAWRDASTGETFATPRNYYSNTTQRSINRWCRNPAIMEESELHAKLASKYSTNE